MEPQYIPPSTLREDTLFVVNHPQYGLTYSDAYGNIFSHPQGGPTPNGYWHSELVQGMSTPRPTPHVPPPAWNPRQPGTEVSPTYRGPR